MSITRKALLVSLSIGTPPQSRKIKQASEEIEHDKKTAKKQASVVSKLFAKRDLAHLIKVATEARATFKERTLPWARGMGMIPTAKYFEFIEEMRQIKERFNSERQLILDDFSAVLANAATVNGDLFDLKNYPAFDEMKSAMYFSIEVTPVPDVNAYDELAGLTDDEVAKLKDEAVLNAGSRTEAAIKDLFSRLFKSLQHAATRLKPAEDGSTNVFRDTLLENISKALLAAETLNINDDAAIKEMVEEIKQALEGLTANDLRADAELRQETARKTEELAQKVSNFL